MARYKYASAHEWLTEYAGKLKPDQLYNEFMALAQKVDADTIQDLYQSDMDADGFFKDLDYQVPALFVTDNGEATGTVHLFCSDKCLRVFETDEDVKAGVSPVTVDGATCEECGSEL